MLIIPQETVVHTAGNNFHEIKRFYQKIQLKDKKIENKHVVFAQFPLLNISSNTWMAFGPKYLLVIQIIGQFNQME